MLRLTSAALVAVLATLPPLAAFAQDSGQVRVGAPDLSSFQGNIEAAAAAACDNSALSNKANVRYKIFILDGRTEYTLGTCKANGKGSWTVNSQEKCETGNCGKVTLGTLTGLHLGNGDCPDHTYSFAAICYTWQKHNNAKITDTIVATWHPPTLSDEQFTYSIKVPIVRPKTEDTMASGWDGEGLGRWQQTIHNDKDPGFDWSYDSVREHDPGGDKQSNDTCWCSGSAIDPFYRITGGKWYPDETGKWEFDHVGWCTAHGPDFCPGTGALPVQYYRSKHRAPCGTTFPQQMQFQATAVSKTWYDYGDVNTLGGRFNYTTVYSERAGQSQHHSVSPQTSHARISCTAFKGAELAAQMTFGNAITVNDPRPVAAAIEAIERVTHRPITYEDAPVQYRAQLMSMVAGAAADDSLLVPRGGTLSLTLPADGSAAAAVTSLKGAVESYNSTHRAATFAVLEDEVVHVVPRQAADSAGRLAPVTPLLDSKITIERKPRTAIALLGAICDAVSAATGQTVGLGTVPFNRLHNNVAIGAENATAREVLQEALATTGVKASWRLLYDPGLKQYFLNIPVIE